MRDEIWMNIEGFGGKYQVSNLGNVMSFGKHSRGGKLLGQRLDRYGYLRLTLTGTKSVKEYYTIHRLVALAFIPNPDNKLTVNHINGIRTDNRVENLEWCTMQENIIHSFRVLNKVPSWAGKKRGRHLDTKRAKKILQIDPISNQVVKVWERINDAARAGFLQSKISLVCNGHRISTGGYKWQFANN